MKLKILLIGKNGQVGRELGRLLPSVGEVFALDRRQLDLLKPDDVRRTIREIRPQLIVNAAAYTAVDQAESDEPTARAINADAPLLMAQEAKKVGAALVHYSTDYVFDGLKTSPYCESDAPNPVSVYGKTKLAGELAIQEAGVPHLIFRTAWVYATHGRNFLLTILRLASEREELRVVSDQIGAPTWARELARATVAVIDRILRNHQNEFSSEGMTGIYHMTATGVTNWFAFAKAILGEASQSPIIPAWMAIATKGRPLITNQISAISTIEYPTAARRPAYSVLSNSLLDHTFDVQLRDWRSALHDAFESES
jgi:dTDP-4-dehydrorhamnose reductase